MRRGLRKRKPIDKQVSYLSQQLQPFDGSAFGQGDTSEAQLTQMWASHFLCLPILQGAGKGKQKDQKEGRPDEVVSP